MSHRYDDEEFLAWLKAHFAKVPFFKFLGVGIVRLARGEADLRIQMRPEYANTYGISHGGVVAALCDMATGVALRTMQIRLVTVETSTNYHERVPLDAEVTAYARVVYQGKRIANGSVEVRNKDGVLVASGKTTFYIIGEARIESEAE
jgi:acyl-CoA thioesterase